MKLRKADLLGQEIAKSPHFHAMPGMRMKSPDGWVRLQEGECLKWGGWPDMLDAATMGCLAQIAWRIVDHAKQQSALRQQAFFPTTFVAGDLDGPRIDIPNCVWAYDRFIRCTMLNGVTSLEAAEEIATVFMEAL